MQYNDTEIPANALLGLWERVEEWLPEGISPYAGQPRITAGSITPQEIWATKDQWLERVRQSYILWEAFSPERQQELIDAVRADLAAEIVNPGYVDIEVKSGNYVEYNLEIDGFVAECRVILTDIDKDINNNEDYRGRLEDRWAKFEAATKVN